MTNSENDETEPLGRKIVLLISSSILVKFHFILLEKVPLTDNKSSHQLRGVHSWKQW